MKKGYEDPGRGKKFYQSRLKHWQMVIADQAASGLSIKEFCNQHGLKKRQLSDWKYRLRKLGLVEQASKKAVAGEGFIPVVITKGEEVSKPEINLELELSSGNICRLNFAYDELIFSKILEAIGRC